jgi:hypothetical protein
MLAIMYIVYICFSFEVSGDIVRATDFGLPSENEGVDFYVSIILCVYFMVVIEGSYLSVAGT